MKPSQIRILLEPRRLHIHFVDSLKEYDPDYAAALAALEVALSRLLAPWFDEVEVHTEGGATMLEVAKREEE